MPTQPAQQLLYLPCICAFLGDRSTKGGGGGGSIPRAASRLLLLWHQTSDVSMSSEVRVRHRILDIKHRTSDIGSGISDIRLSILDIRHQISDIRNQTSDIGYRTTDIRRRSMDVRRQISGMGCILIPELCVLSLLVQNGSVLMFWLDIQIFLNGNHICSK